MVGAAALVAYSASMNSYLSLTDAPLRSTPLLLTGIRFSSGAHGFPAPARGASPFRKPAAAARCPRAFPGKPAPSSRAMSPPHRAPGQRPRQNVTSPPPGGRLPHGIPESNSFVFEAISRSFPAEDPKGSAVRKDGGAPVPARVRT